MGDKMGEPTGPDVPPGYTTSIEAALGIPADRAKALRHWLFATIIPTCPLRSDVLDMIDAGRGVENLTQSEKLFLAYTFGRLTAMNPPGMVVLFGGRGHE